MFDNCEFTCEILILFCQVDEDRKKIEDLLRERDILNKQVLKSDDRTKTQIDLVKRQETTATNLQKDLERWQRDVDEYSKRIRDVENQRDTHAIEFSTFILSFIYLNTIFDIHVGNPTEFYITTNI